MRELLRSKAFLAVVVVAALVGMYAWFGFSLAPKIVRTQAIEFVRETYARELQIGEVRVQPFKLQLEVRDLAFPDAGGQPMLRLRRLFVDFELSSLWHRAYVFKELIIEAPSVRTVVRPDGVVNLADLAPKQASPPPPEEETALPRLWIKSLEVTGGRLEYVDLARRVRYSEVFQPVTFALKDFKTTAEGGDFRLSARSEENEQFDWKGRFQSTPQIASQGEFTIAALRAAGVAKFLGDALPFGLSAGMIDVAGSYRVSLGEQLDLKVKLPKVALSGLALRARGVDADWIQVPRLELSNVSVAMPEQTATIAAVALTGLKAQCWLAADGSVNLMQLLESGAPAATVAPPAAAQPAGASEPQKDWTLQVGSVEVKGAAVDLEDRMKAPVKRFAIAPINLHVGNASLDLAKPLPVSLDATINGHAVFKAAGTLAPDPLAADLDVSLERASMKFLQPYVLPLADLTIRDGWLAAAGKLKARPAGGAEPQLSFMGQASIEHFKSIDNALKQDLINFGRLRVEKLRYHMAPDSLKIDRVLLQQLYARVVISREQILNISAVLDPQGAAAALQEWHAKEARAAKESRVEKREREKQEAARAAQIKKEEKARAKYGSPAPTPAAQAAAAPELMPIRIRELRFEAGRMNFSDYSVPPYFSAEVLDLQGSVTQLSSARDSRAKVDLSGNLGEFSPVTIGGELEPFAYDRYTDIGLNFENISLPIFNPYSGKFAGYNIAKGKLFTDLHYLIQDRALQASHKIRIEQLEWGEASPEKGEATLPVKFATWLLKDRNGIINLDIPVTGSIDDPKLRIGPIVWQIIKNLIVKAVTAPFKLLGALFKGAEEAQFIDFAPGGSALDPQAAERLATLAKSLVEKPGIRLEVPAGITAALDRPALIELRYQEQLSGAMAASLHRSEDDKAPMPAFGSLPPGRQIDILTSLVQQQTGAAPRIPAPPAPPDGTPRAEAKALRETAAIEYLEKDVHSRLVVTDADLEALGAARAQAVQHALLTGSGLEPARVFVTKNGKVSAAEGKVRFELALE